MARRLASSSARLSYGQAPVPLFQCPSRCRSQAVDAILKVASGVTRVREHP
jgi:hypothetical protein